MAISAPTTQGPQNPSKYPRTGPSYAYYGEQQGFVYNPWTDRYVPDPNAVRQYEEAQGIREPEKKPPSAANTIGGLIGGSSSAPVASSTTAGTGTGAAEAGTTAASTSGGLLPALGVGLGAGAVSYYYGPSYMKYGSQLASGKINQDSGLKSAALSNPITAWAVPIADKLGISFGSNGKGKRQLVRDKVRDFLVDNKVVDKKDYQLKFSDGSTFDIGKDGGARLKNTKGEERQYSDVDFSDPRAGMVVGSVNPLAAIITGGDKQASNDFAGTYTNAILNGSPDNATANQRLRELYAKHNVTAVDAIKTIDQLIADKRIDAQTGAAYKNGINVVFGAKPIDLNQPVGAPPGVAPIAPGQTPASTVNAASGGMIPQRTGRSPGFDKNGKRINYGNS